MNPHELLTRADLVDFEKRLLSKLSDLITQISIKETQVQDDLLTKKQMMQALSVSENTFDNLVSNGLPFIPVGKRARYDFQEVVKFLKNKNKFIL